MSTKLIIGLGNPGKKYANTRHNIGFMCLDAFAKKNGLVFKLDKKMNGEIAEIMTEGNKTVFLKPSTYMNLSGDAVSKVMQYYKIALEDILVIYDDLDLNTGRFRLREKGSAGGHNGMKSIIGHVKSQEFKRLRIGISKRSERDTIDHVLGQFGKDELKDIDIAIEHAIDIMRDFIIGHDFLDTMTRFNTLSNGIKTPAV